MTAVLLLIALAWSEVPPVDDAGAQSRRKIKVLPQTNQTGTSAQEKPNSR
jgi:hypothetical protein